MLYRCKLCDLQGRHGPEHKQFYKDDLLEYAAEDLNKDNLFYLSDFRNHVILHGTRAKKYRALYDDPIDVKYASFHLCHICNKKMILTNDHVKNHAKKHNTIGREYIEKHIYPMSTKFSVSLAKKEDDDCGKCVAMKARFVVGQLLIF